MCAFGGDHEATGSRVQAFNVPLGKTFQNGVVTFQLCEEHCQDSVSMPIGEYHAILHIMETKSDDSA